MRLGFGLVGLLVAVALMAWMFASYTRPVAQEGKKAQEQAYERFPRDSDRYGRAHYADACFGQECGSARAVLHQAYSAS